MKDSILSAILTACISYLFKHVFELEGSVIYYKKLKTGLINSRLKIIRFLLILVFYVLLIYVLFSSLLIFLTAENTKLAVLLVFMAMAISFGLLAFFKINRGRKSI